MCFEKMLTTLVSTLEDRSNSADAIASISSRLALNSANKSPVEPLRRSAKSLSAAMLIWHCTIFCPFLIVNLNVIKAASYPTAFPRVSGMNQLPFQWSVEADHEVGPPAERLVLLRICNGLFGPAARYEILRRGRRSRTRAMLCSTCAVSKPIALAQPSRIASALRPHSPGRVLPDADTHRPAHAQCEQIGARHIRNPGSRRPSPHRRA